MTTRGRSERNVGLLIHPFDGVVDLRRRSRVRSSLLSRLLHAPHTSQNGSLRHIWRAQLGCVRSRSARGRRVDGVVREGPCHPAGAVIIVI